MIDLRKTFDEFNKDFFYSKLPWILVEWSDRIPATCFIATHVHGYTRCLKKYCPPGCETSFIRVHPMLKYLELDGYVCTSLLHEMAHCMALPTKDRRYATHGGVWNAEMDRLERVGAFHEFR